MHAIYGARGEGNNARRVKQQDNVEVNSKVKLNSESLYLKLIK